MGTIVIQSVPQYLDEVQKILLSLQHQGLAEIEIDGPHWLPFKDDWLIVTFRSTAKFSTGHLLDISENFSRRESWGRLGSEWKRKRAYYCGDSEGRRLFLIDSHGKFGEPCHLQPDDDTRLFDGDARLNGFCPSTVDFIDIYKIVMDNIEDKPFPWNGNPL